MYLHKDVFVPSQALDAIYDMLDEHIIVAGNEDIYDKDIVTEIPKLLDKHSRVKQFCYSTRTVDYSTEMLIVSWIENSVLLHEVFLYDNGNRMEDDIL
jgi:hypothetical protein